MAIGDGLFLNVVLFRVIRTRLGIKTNIRVATATEFLCPLNFQGVIFHGYETICVVFMVEFCNKLLHIINKHTKITHMFLISKEIFKVTFNSNSISTFIAFNLH